MRKYNEPDTENRIFSNDVHIRNLKLPKMQRRSIISQNYELVDREFSEHIPSTVTNRRNSVIKPNDFDFNPLSKQLSPLSCLSPGRSPHSIAQQS